MPALQAAQTQAPAPPPPIPQLPQEAPAPTAIINGVPQSLADVQALRAQRTELSNQLISAQGRRDEIAAQLAEASAAERPGLEARLQQLDARILQIESNIERTGQLMASAPGQYLRETSSGSGVTFPNVTMRPDITAIAVVFTIFVLAPISISIARLFWRRATQGPVTNTIDKDTADRLRRLESGVDAIAIEVERISEGQRFVTKLMADRERQRLPAER
ncbi:MAG: hypothetical protein KF709_09950 [Gemmatimonadaceae bacterium]|nr:hypothetical protein [Gemmatimonadaceae bacterium]